MNTKRVLVISAMFFTVSSSFAAEAKVSAEDRQRMSEMHLRMATCLQSDKPMNECQSEMMKSCKEIMGKTGCPMTEMGYMKGMMGHGMMNQEEKSKPEKNEKK